MGKEGAKRAGGEISGQYLPPALPEHGDHAAETTKGEDAEKRSPYSGASQRGVDYLPQMRAVPAHFFRFGRIALNSLDLRKRFVRSSGRLGDAILYAGARLPQRTSKNNGRADNERYDSQRGRGQTTVGYREQDDSADQEQGLSRELGEIVAEDRLQDRSVRREATGELTSSALGEESG